MAVKSPFILGGKQQLKTYRVTLDLTVDAAHYDPIDKWDWDGLIGLVGDEKIAIRMVAELNSPAEARANDGAPNAPAGGTQDPPSVAETR